MRFDIPEIMKFVLVGASGTIITLSFFFVLTEYFSIWYPVSLALGWFFGFLNNFYWNRSWTFKIKAGNTYKQGGIYFVCTMIALLSNEIVTISLTELGGSWYFLSGIAGTGVSTIINYILVKNFALNPDKGTSKSTDNPEALNS